MNRRSNPKDKVARRRLKLGANETWFRRRRGGVLESIKKENNWRHKSNVESTPPPPNRTKRGAQDKTRIQRKPPSSNKANVQVHRDEASGKRYLQTDATLLVPFTANSKLCTELQKKENLLAVATNTPKIRMVEKGGEKLVHSLSKTDPNQNERTCGRGNCQNCVGRMKVVNMLEEMKEQGKSSKEMKKKWKSNPNCRREGTVYRIDCVSCIRDQDCAQDSQNENKTREINPVHTETTYIGETSRSSYERFCEHHADLCTGKTSSPLVVHGITHHRGSKPEFIMRTLSLEVKALRRMVTEAVLIVNKTSSTVTMNRKHELGLVPRLQVVGGGGGVTTTGESKDAQKNQVGKQM